MLIADMSPGQVRANYIFYIGAGAVASAGIIALVRALPTIVSAFRSGFQDLEGSVGDRGHPAAHRPRPADLGHDRRLDRRWRCCSPCCPQIGVNLLGALLIVVFGFFFVTVSSRITGEIGVERQPDLGHDHRRADRHHARSSCCIGWTGVDHRVGALSIAGVIAVAVGQRRRHQPGPQDRLPGRRHAAPPADRHHGRRGDLGARDRLDPDPAQQHLHQHRARVASRRRARGRGAGRAPTARSRPPGETLQHDGRTWAVVPGERARPRACCPGKYLVDPATQRDRATSWIPASAGGSTSSTARPVTKLDSPKATIMALVTDGILTQKLPWGLVLLGVFITLGIELMGAAVAAGGGRRLPADLDLLGDVRGRRWCAGWWSGALGAASQSIAEVESGPGVLFSSGLIAGGAIAGIAVAGLATLFASAADKAGVPAADYLAHRAGTRGARSAGWSPAAGRTCVALGLFLRPRRRCSSGSRAGTTARASDDQAVTEALQLGDGASIRPLDGAATRQPSWSSSSRTGLTSTSGCAGRRRCAPLPT